MQRKFVNPTVISKYLMCSICTEVFIDPTRIPCGHLYCRECIEQWCQNQQRAPSCPHCRQTFKRNQIVKDQLAYNLINEFEIFCPNRGCNWKGALESIQGHLPQCTFKEGNLPKWYLNYMKSKEEELKKEQNEEECLDDNVRAMINQNVPKQTLAERLIKPNNADQLRRVLGIEDSAHTIKVEPRNQEEEVKQPNFGTNTTSTATAAQVSTTQQRAVRGQSGGRGKATSGVRGGNGSRGRGRPRKNQDLSGNDPQSLNHSISMPANQSGLNESGITGSNDNMEDFLRHARSFMLDDDSNDNGDGDLEGMIEQQKRLLMEFNTSGVNQSNQVLQHQQSNNLMMDPPQARTLPNLNGQIGLGKNKENLNSLNSSDEFQVPQGFGHLKPRTIPQQREISSFDDGSSLEVQASQESNFQDEQSNVSNDFSESDLLDPANYDELGNYIKPNLKKRKLNDFLGSLQMNGNHRNVIFTQDMNGQTKQQHQQNQQSKK
eukprot:403350340